MPLQPTDLEQKLRQTIAELQIPAARVTALKVSEAGQAVVVLYAADRKEAEAMEPLRSQLSAQIAALDGVSAAQVVLSNEVEQPRCIIAVASGKGGVGKSTVSANLAVALAQLGFKVGLLDADIYGPSQPIMMGLPSQPPPLDGNKKMIPPVAHGVKVMSIGFMVKDDQALVWRGPMVQSAIRQMLSDVAWGGLDILLIDLPPGTGDAQLSVAQQANLHGAVIVSTPQDLALADARRAVAMFGKVNVPVLGMIENMSVFCCPNCGHASAIFGQGGAKVEAERLGLPYLGALALDMEVRTLGDAGTPICAAKPEGQAAQLFKEIALSLRARLGVAQAA